jgi:hypothetical protein
MRKALSLIEILLVLGILAIVVGLSTVAYRGIRSQAKDVARMSDQRNFLKALDTFRSLGGDAADILESTSLSAVEKGQALLTLVTQSADSGDRNKYGAVSELMDEGAAVVPVTSSDTTSTRIVITNGVAKLATSGDGFAVVSATNEDIASASATASGATSAAADATTTASDTTGSNYATQTKYLWDSDASGIDTTGVGDTSSDTGDTPNSSVDNATTLGFQPVYSVTGGQFTYANYTSASAYIYIFIYRKDLKDLSASDLSLVYGFNNSTVTPTTTSIGSGSTAGISAKGIWAKFVNPNVKLLAATSWTTDTYNISVTATSKNAEIQSGTDTVPVYALAVDLASPTITDSSGSSSTLQFTTAGNTLTVDSATPNSGISVKTSMGTVDLSTLSSSCYTVSDSTLTASKITWTRTN